MSSEENNKTRHARNRSGRGAREMHTATCSSCGQEARVPFVPSPERPVYCADCFRAAKDRPASIAPAPTEDPELEFTVFGLDERLLRAVKQLGYRNPTPIQVQGIPAVMTGDDLIGTAQTGTGKTAVFVLPILHRLLTRPVTERRTRVLIVAPTRELAEQINTAIKQLGVFTGIRSATVYGGVGMEPQEKALRAKVDIIVACPGRMLDHLKRGTVKLGGIDILVLDEADRLLDMGFMPDVKRLLSHLPRERQTLLFSATFPPELKELTDIMRRPQRVDIGIKAPARTVDHALYVVPAHLKQGLLLSLLEDPDMTSVLTFARTRHGANRLERNIERAGHKVIALHSDKTQGQRQRALDDFKKGVYPIMVATDIAARGLDIVDVTHVINYDIPDTADTYIHRIGRTGRAEKSGDAMTLVTLEELKDIAEIEKILGTRIERRALDRFDYTVQPPPVKEFERALASKQGARNGRAGARSGVRRGRARR